MGNKNSRSSISTNSRKGSARVHSTKDSNNIDTGTSSSISQSANSVMIEGRQYHRMEGSSYFLPRDELEQDRLNSVRYANYTVAIFVS